MLKRILGLALLICLCISVWTSAYLFSQNENLSIDDPMLEKALREQLNIDKDEQLDQSLTFTVTELNLSGYQISSLSGIEHFERLTLLDLSHNAIVDISPIQHLTNIEKLNLENNVIEEILPLQALNKLEILNIRENFVASLAPLEKLDYLRALNVRENRINEITSISNLEHLEDLNIQYNQIESLLPINHLPSLQTRLYLEGNPIQDLDLLSDFYDEIQDVDVPRPEYNIQFSHEPGFYDQLFSIKLSTLGETEGDIRYTTDNSEVTVEDPVYTNPVPIHENTTLKAKFYPEVPEETSEHANSYFINETSYLPIVSISTDANNLFDDQQGIYVSGIYSNTENPLYSGNFMQRGREWERPIFLQLFDKDGNSTFTQHAGVRIHAETDSSIDRKSLRLYARDDYGEARFQYPFFGPDERKQFNRLVLHNGNQDWNRTLLHDPLIHELTKDSHFETQRSQSVNVYLNGEYWGIYHLRERYDSHYFRFAEQVLEEDLDLLEGDGTAIEGNNVDYKQLLAYIREYGASSNESYRYIATQIDIDSFIDFYITQIYAANTEWIDGNLYYWRERPYGKWRLALSNVNSDITDRNTGLQHNTLAWITTRGTDEFATFLFTSLLTNEEFKHQFIQRFAHQLNTTFKSNHASELLSSMIATIERDMHSHINRWEEPINYNQWEHHIQQLQEFVTNRPTHLREYIQSHFQLHGFVEINIAKATTEQITMASYDFEVEEGWTGKYFNDVPLTIDIPNASDINASSTDESVVSVDNNHQLVFVGSGESTIIFSDDLGNHLLSIIVKVHS